MRVSYGIKNRGDTVGYLTQIFAPLTLVWFFIPSIILSYGLTCAHTSPAPHESSRKCLRADGVIFLSSMNSLKIQKMEKEQHIGIVVLWYLTISELVFERRVNK